jgi:hypothetical protein
MVFRLMELWYRPKQRHIQNVQHFGRLRILVLAFVTGQFSSLPPTHWPYPVDVSAATLRVNFYAGYAGAAILVRIGETNDALDVRHSLFIHKYLYYMVIIEANSSADLNSLVFPGTAPVEQFGAFPPPYSR